MSIFNENRYRIAHFDELFTLFDPLGRYDRYYIIDTHDGLLVMHSGDDYYSFNSKLLAKIQCWILNKLGE